MIGRALGHYTIIDRLGAGGMGEVYRARDARLERDVALKVVASNLAEDEEAQRRLRKEALALSSLSHPNIAVVYDFDAFDGVTFVVMELVLGSDLRDRLNRGPLEEKEVVTLGAQAADALQAAHGAGVVHRDLKPANLRLTPQGRLKILDFGLAARVETSADVSPLATETAAVQIAGTLPYMAPEQLRGRPPDPRSDVYALCVVLYEMATGVRPFDRRPDALLIDQILNEAPKPPRAWRPPISPGLEALILKGLDKDPERRYQTARELLVDLQRLGSPSTVASREVDERPSFRARSATRRVAAVTALVFTVTVAAWLVWRGALFGGPVLSFAPRDWILVTDFDNQTGETVFDNALATAFTIGLRQSTHANVVPRARIDEALGRMQRKDAPRIDEALGREIAVRESVRGLIAPGISRVGQQYLVFAKLVDPQSGAEVRSYGERASDADDILNALSRIGDALRRDLGESLESIRQDSRPLPKVTTASLAALQSFADGGELWRKARYKEAVVHYQRAIDHDPDFAMAHAAIGGALASFVFNETARGKQHLDRAMALADRTTEREHMFLQVTYQATLGNRMDAANSYRAYLYRFPDDYRVRYNFGGLLREVRLFDEAVTEYDEVLRLSPNNASVFINLATSHAGAGRTEEALVAYDKAFALEPTWKAGGNLNHEYGFALVQAGRPGDAGTVFGMKLPSREERPGGLRSLALLDLYRGKYRDAEPRLLEAAGLNQSLGRPLSAGRDLFFLAMVRQGRGDRRGELRHLDLASAQFEKAEGFAFLARVGVAYARAGELAKAQRVLTLVTGRLTADPTLRDAMRWLEGEILVARGQTAAGIGALTAAEQEAGSTLQLVRLSLAHAHERAGNVDAAVAAHNEVLREAALGWEPQQAWLGAHYQVARLHKQRNEHDKALARLDALLALWQEADPDLPLLQAARRLRGELGARP
jgi:eukaryotic-like serine/threonine-protein kinase